MDLSIYMQLGRLRIASGVPRHIKEVTSRLIERPGVNVSFFLNRGETEKYIPTLPEKWRDVPRCSFEKSGSAMALRWGIFNKPSFEELGGRSDWLYVPADAYVPTREAKLAVTLHDVYRLEPPAHPGNRLEHYHLRLRQRIVYGKVARYADRIFTVSNFSAERIMHYLKVPMERIRVVYNGVGAAFFTPDSSRWEPLQARLGIRKKEFLIYVGGLKAKKNGAGIIAAWRLVEHKNKDVKLLVLGHNHPDFLKQAERELRNLVYTDGISDEDLSVLLSNSIALFFPSFYEGFGIPVVEALASGAPVIASDIPAIREIVGGLATYVDPRDHYQMAEAILARASRPASGSDETEKGRKLAKRFTWDSCAQRVLDGFRR